MPKRKEIGIITKDERDEIQKIYIRKLNLSELGLIVKDTDDIFEKYKTEKTNNQKEFDKWWEQMYEKYHWESENSGKWGVDFDKCTIYLETND